jgi:hypothetical protein
MGQYYHPILLNDRGKIIAWIHAHEYRNGLKLMEHSYLQNNFVQAFEFLLAPDQKYHKTRVVWAGDYADQEPEGPNLYNLCRDEEKIQPEYLYDTTEYPYIVNHTKMQFVDKRKNIDVRKGALGLHPLPLLTCEGNGRGGGDYRGESPLIGLWARDIISIEENKPTNCVEIVFNLKE